MKPNKLYRILSIDAQFPVRCSPSITSLLVTKRPLPDVWVMEPATGTRHTQLSMLCAEAHSPPSASMDSMPRRSDDCGITQLIHSISAHLLLCMYAGAMLEVAIILAGVK